MGYVEELFPSWVEVEHTRATKRLLPARVAPPAWVLVERGFRERRDPRQAISLSRGTLRLFAEAEDEPRGTDEPA
jgi:hypothetical protein